MAVSEAGAAADGDRHRRRCGAEAGAVGFLSEDGELLDLTGHQLKSLGPVALPATLTELDLTANRLADLDPRLAQLPRLRRLFLRQNLLADDAARQLAGCASLASLEELVLRDNQLEQWPPLGTFSQLRRLDVSFNKLSSLAGLADGPACLEELYASNNAISKMEKLDHLSSLKLLELGSNKIRVMEGLQHLLGLTELWLGRNKIREANMFSLSGLRKVSIQSNRLTSMLGFEECRLLEELYLSHNGISKVEGLSTLSNLKILDISANQISKIENLQGLTRLEDLWCNDNGIQSLDDLDLVSLSSHLTTIYLERNPCADDPQYISWLQATLPQLQQIDANVLQHSGV
eukprot:SM000079S22485  [mRNA]  locus=s79:443204:445359:- [translate_table: standard]